MKPDELAFCRLATEDLLNHECAWAFRKPVNMKQVPIYRKVIKKPMDLSTIRRKVRDPTSYPTFKSWVSDVRLIFQNCEIFNEDDSEIGRAGHTLHAYFEAKWSKWKEGNDMEPESNNVYCPTTSLMANVHNESTIQRVESPVPDTLHVSKSDKLCQKESTDDLLRNHRVTNYVLNAKAFDTTNLIETECVSLNEVNSQSQTRGDISGQI